jgi:hypothetical protein
MAWDKTKPENDMLLINFPAACRANWDAIELLTNANLLITNAKISPTAGIVDTKLAQITTASKVHGSSITGLANVVGGAGVLPEANSPNKLKADAADSTPQYLDSLINTSMFQITGGDLLELKDAGVETEKLEGGAASPGNNKAYGTNSGGTKGFYDSVDLATTQTMNGAKTMDALTLGGNLACNDKQMLNMIIENRTNDSGMTVTGQIWFRTDV